MHDNVKGMLTGSNVAMYDNDKRMLTGNVALHDNV